MVFNFADKNDRAKLEKRLSAQYDTAQAAEDLDSLLRLNALIEKCWLKDDEQGLLDPPLKNALVACYLDWLKENPQDPLISF